MVTSSPHLGSAQKILAACQHLASEQGIGQLRVDKVAQLAGVNKRMIYHHFGNKKGLQAELARWQIFVIKQHLEDDFGFTERLFGSASTQESSLWPLHDIGDKSSAQLAGRIFLQLLATADVGKDIPSRGWEIYCSRVVNLALFGVSEHLHTRIGQRNSANVLNSDKTSERGVKSQQEDPGNTKINKPRYRLAAGRRHVPTGGDGTSKS